MILSTTTDEEESSKALKRFWELYWGELALVENRAVEAAMVGLSDALRANATQDELQPLTLELAHACRNSLDRSWGTRAWTEPDEAASAT